MYHMMRFNPQCNKTLNCHDIINGSKLCYYIWLENISHLLRPIDTDRQTYTNPPTQHTDTDTHNNHLMRDFLYPVQRSYVIQSINTW